MPELSKMINLLWGANPLQTFHPAPFVHGILDSNMLPSGQFEHLRESSAEGGSIDPRIFPEQSFCTVSNCDGSASMKQQQVIIL
jgi:hypothetical protein